jgi:ankyrin repeat protein
MDETSASRAINMLLLATKHSNAERCEHTASGVKRPGSIANKSAGVDFAEITDDSGSTALHLACTNGKVALVKVLVESGRVDVTRVNDLTGKSALDVVREGSPTKSADAYEKIIEYLLGA